MNTEQYERSLGDVEAFKHYGSNFSQIEKLLFGDVEVICFNVFLKKLRV